LQWLTEITHVREGEYFADDQLVGPYAVWHHEHWFRQVDPGRIEVEDRVTYVLPLGWLGDLAHARLVGPKLERIFAWREQMVQAVFPG